VVDTGGSPVESPVVGIIAGMRTVVVDNQVHGVKSDADLVPRRAFGLLVEDNIGGLVARNHVTGVDSGGMLDSQGIATLGGARFSLVDNVVVGTGLAGSRGIVCDSVGVRARGNTVTDFPSGIEICGNGGGNDVSP
jgi:hypothetical protein